MFYGLVKKNQTHMHTQINIDKKREQNAEIIIHNVNDDPRGQINATYIDSWRRLKGTLHSLLERQWECDGIWIWYMGYGG